VHPTPAVRATPAAEPTFGAITVPPPLSFSPVSLDTSAPVPSFEPPPPSPAPPPVDNPTPPPTASPNILQQLCLAIPFSICPSPLPSPPGQAAQTGSAPALPGIGSAARPAQPAPLELTPWLEGLVFTP
jgi:hypothetical protein